LVLMELRNRRIVHVAVTASPTLAWLKQRIREATPFGSRPRFLVHDNDGIFGQFGRRRPGKSGRSYRSALDLWLGEALHIKGVPIPYGAPNGSPHRTVHGKPEEEVPEPLHVHLRRPSSPHSSVLHRLLQSRPTSSGDRGDPGVRTGPAGRPLEIPGKGLSWLLPTQRSAASTTTTASPPSSELPADCPVGITDSSRSRQFPPCWVLPSAWLARPRTLLDPE
jgi:hypothetical protein